MRKLSILFMLSILSTVIYSCVKDSNANDLSNTDTTEIVKYIAELEAKIESLSSQVDTLGNKIDPLVDQVDTLGNKINALEDQVDAQGNKINALEDQVDALESQITGNGNPEGADKPYGYVEKSQRVIEQTIFSDGFTIKSESKYDNQGRLIKNITGGTISEYEYSGNECRLYMTDKPLERKLHCKILYQE